MPAYVLSRDPFFAHGCSGGMELRLFHACDPAVRLEVATALVAEWPDDFGSEGGPEGVVRLIEKRFATWESEHRVFLVARLRGRLLGTFSIEHDLEGKFTPCLANLWVHPSARGKGIGRLFVRIAERYVRKRGVSVMYLWCLDGLPSYYEKLGYKIVESTLGSRGQNIHFMGRSVV